MLDNLLNLFISSAHASDESTTGAGVAEATDAANQAVGAGAGMSEILILVVFVLIFYFMLWRPQSKRAKEHRQLMASLGKGDEVVTAGGILGKISKLQDDLIYLTISDNVEIRVQKGSVVAVLPKGTVKPAE